ncbi:hypothetical protein CFP56_029135 [Quercus suber]|uniref:Uncharacterized protein n=1 Tax=Quercus suber TaxID=58331 RepID=A0AAW0MAE5_QUESU
MLLSDWCGFLNHSLRECSEGQALGDKDGACQLQYGAWLRGEPMRRGGREGVAQGARREATECNGATEVSPTAPAKQQNTVKESLEGREDVLAEEGKVKELVGKKEEKAAVLGRFSEEKPAAKADFAEGMQWETALGQRSQLISEGDLAPKNKVKMTVVGPALENPIPGPLAMCYDDKKGWTSKTLGPASRHWKRLARATKGFLRSVKAQTKAGTNRIKGIQSKLEYTQGIIVPSDGRSGGLALLWREGTEVHFKSCSNSHIDVEIHDNSAPTPYTWCDGRAGEQRTKLRLDRMVASESWLDRFPNASVHHVSMSISDHCLLSLCLHRRKPRKPARKRFFFEAMWTREAGCRELIEDVWDPVGRDSRATIMDRLQNCQEQLSRWNWRVFGNVNNTLRH